MRTIETTVEVTPEHRVTLELPPDLPPGRHRVVMVFDEQPLPPPESTLAQLQAILDAMPEQIGFEGIDPVDYIRQLRDLG